MKIVFLGKWSSNLIPGERNVSFLLDNKIALDFGPHSLESLLDKGIDPNEIRTILISHMHLDHYAGIAELMWYRSIYRAKGRLTIFGPRGIRRNTERLLRILNTPPPWYDEQINRRIDYAEEAEADSIRVFRAKHTIRCISYRINYKGTTLFYSGDTSYSENTVRGARDADWLFYETTYTDKDRKLADYWGHSTWGDAMKVFERSGAKHLVPVHLTRASSELVRKLSGKVDGLLYPPDTLEL